MDERSRLRADEAVAEGCVRVATDAVYYARDHNGSMHDAAQQAAEAVLGLLRDHAPGPMAMIERSRDGSCCCSAGVTSLECHEHGGAL